MKIEKEQWKQVITRVQADIRSYYPVAVGLLLYGILAHIIFHRFCPFVIATGIPCAGCGLTRAFYFVITGKFAMALQYNACIFIWMIAIAYAGIGRYAYGRQLKGTTAIFTVTVLCSLAYYCYRMVQFPSGIPPMVYEERNIFHQIIPFYDQILYKILGSMIK